MDRSTSYGIRLQIFHRNDASEDAIDLANEYIATTVNTLFGRKTPWIPKFEDESSQVAKVILRRRLDSLPDGTVRRHTSTEGDEDTVSQLCDDMLNPQSPLFLQKWSGQHKVHICLFQSHDGTRTPAEIIFGQYYISGTISRAGPIGEGGEALKELDKIDSQFPTRCGKIWMCSALNAVFTTADILECFEPILSMIPSIVPTHDNAQSNRNAKHNNEHDSEPNNEQSYPKVERFLKFLKALSSEKPDIKSVVEALLAKIDGEELKLDIPSTSTAFHASSSQLPELLKLFLSTLSPEQLEDALGPLQTTLNNGVQLYHACSNDLAIKSEQALKWGVISAVLWGVTGWLILGVAGPPGWLIIGSSALSAAAAAASCYKTCRAGVEWSRSRSAKMHVYDVMQKLYKTWLFLSLYRLRSEGRLPDDDPALRNFATKMATDVGIDGVITDWANPEYLRSYLETEAGLIKTSLGELQDALRKVKT